MDRVYSNIKLQLPKLKLARGKCIDEWQRKTGKTLAFMTTLQSSNLTYLLTKWKKHDHKHKWALVSHRRNVCLRHYSIHTVVHSWRRPLASTNTNYNSINWRRLLKMTLIFDLWPWKPLQQCPRTWRISVASFIEIPPLSTETSCQAKQMLTDNGRTTEWTTGEHSASTACCWRRHNYKRLTVAMIQAAVATNMT